MASGSWEKSGWLKGRMKRQGTFIHGICGIVMYTLCRHTKRQPKMKPMRKCQKPQFLKWPLEADSKKISIQPHVKMDRFTAEINMFTAPNFPIHDNMYSIPLTFNVSALKQELTVIHCFYMYTSVVYLNLAVLNDCAADYNITFEARAYYFWLLLQTTKT